MRVNRAPLFFAVILALFVIVYPATIAMAHKLNVFAYSEDSSILGEAYFNDGAPARNCEVLVKAEGDGSVVGRGWTDEDGKFSVDIDPSNRKIVTVVVDGGMGHLGRVNINLSSFDNSTDMSDSNSTDKVPMEEEQIENLVVTLDEKEIAFIVKSALRSEIEPLHAEIIQLRKELSKPGFNQIMGGVGYIFGLIGIALWFKKGSGDGHDKR
ncbi:nickel transport protein [Acetomicrobium thermoterrenum DSM 13490]|uniref:Nickel transport protein n=1 Tax=Acetomicrobium thermoterrenum DSM 13490 TaxID=1120987 RepID=A0A1H3EBN5_9BACT|nr:hypothetical protein [Acetomicrobium thermoterrenum]SDX75668.1 nickel transport protein [Acetomicrobium thermoterrenum DSM 13490]